MTGQDIGPLAPLQPVQPVQEPEPAQDPLASTEVQAFLARRAAQLGISFERAKGVSPPAFAEAKSLGATLGRPTEAVMLDIEQARVDAMRRKASDLEFQRAHPVLYNAMRDVRYLPAIRDDLDNLQATEGKWGWIGRSWNTARDTSTTGTIGMRAMIEGRDFNVAEKYQLQMASDRAAAHAARADGGFLESAINLVGSMLDSAVTGTAVGVLSGPVSPVTVPAALYAQSFRLEGGNLYAELVQAGYTPAEAKDVVLRYAPFIAALDVVGIEAAGKPFRAMAGNLLPKVFARSVTAETRNRALLEAGKSYLAAVLGESTTEGLQEVVGMLGKEELRAERRPGDPSAFDMGQAVDVFMQTAKGMMLVGGFGAGGQFASGMVRAADAEHAARVFESLAQLEDESKLAGRSPDDRAAFITEAATKHAQAPNVYIDGQKFAQAIRDSDAAEARETGQATASESLEQLLPGITAKVRQAEADGADVVLPTGDFVTKLGRTELGRTLFQHAKFDPEGMTPAEGRKALEERPELLEEARKQAQAAMAADKDFADSARRVEDALYEQIRATKRLPNAKQERAAAQFYRDFVVTQAVPRGLTPEQFQERYPVQVARGDGQQATASLRQSEAPAALVSALRSNVDALPTKATAAAGWKSALQGLVNKGAVKQAEIEWTGLQEWLDLQDGKVTKEQVQAFLDGNGVQVQTVQLGGETDAVRRQQAIDQELEKLDRIISYPQPGENRDEAIQQRTVLQDEWHSLRGGQKDAKFAQYQLPGGTNYREVLLTLPAEWTEAQVLAEARKLAMGEGVDLDAEQHPVVRDSWLKEARKALDRSGGPDGFKSSHFDQPNILAHLRLNDRVDADGKRVLFVEEIQSDWAQKGRKTGFAKPVKQFTVFYRGADGTKVDVGHGATAAEAMEAAKAWQSMPVSLETEERALPKELATTSGVPRAPFVETTEGWLNLALKQVLLTAVNEGYDKVAFITGEQSAERYDLSKQVDAVHAYPAQDGTWEINATKDGSVLVVERGIDAAGVANLVGKDLADKIVAKSGQRENGSGGQEGYVYRGVDLKVGGEGMRAFYDKIVPKAVEKLAKKLGGEVVEVEGIVEGEPGTEWRVQTGANTAQYFNTRAEALEKAAALGIPGQVLASVKRNDSPQPGIAITDAMRAEIGKGLALFQNGEADAKGGFIPETLTVLLNEKADISSFLHESAHAFLTIYGDMAAQGDAQATADLTTLLDWFGVKDVATWNAMTLEQQRKHHEKFAYSFEGYVFDGVAPSEEMRGLFDRFKVWLRRIYETIRENIGAVYEKEFGEPLPILTGEVRQVMDRMLASEQAIAEAEAVRNMVPLFQTQEQFLAQGGTLEKWAAYQEMAKEAREAGLAELDARSLRAMQWSSGARGRILKALQAQHDDVRGKVRREVVAEVFRRPEYAIPRFIKNAELVNADGTVTTVETEGDRRMDRQAVYQYLGLAVAAEKLPKMRKGKSLATFIRDAGGISWESWQRFPGERGAEFRPKGLVRKKDGGGMAWDYMADAAREEGYGPQGITRDEDDYNWFIDAIADAASGQHEYSTFDTSAQSQQEQERNAPPTDAERKKQLRAEIRADDKERARRREILKPFRGLLTDGGASPDMMAEAFADYGVTSGEQLVRLLADAAPLGEAIAARTDERMHAEHSDLADPAEVEAAVERALHNEARARFVAAELRHLQGATQPVRVMLAAAKEAARQAIAGMPLRDVSAKKFAQAEARAARNAMEAMRKGDSAAAAEWQQKRLLQHALATVAGDVQAQVDKELRNLARFRKPDAKVAKSRDVDLVNAARWILSRYNLGTPNQADSATKSLQAVAAYDPTMGAQLAPLIADADQNGRDYRDLTVEQFTDLMAKVGGLWDDSRRNQQIRLDGKLVEKAEARQRIVDQLAKAAAKGRKPVSGLLRGIGGITASLRHVESWALEMDGGQPGPVHDLLFRMLRDPYDSYLLARAALTNELQERIKGLSNLYGRKYEARFLKDKDGKAHVWKDRAEVVGWLLHTGNAENMRKDAVGRGWVVLDANGEADLSPVRREIQRLVDEGHVTKADLDFVQSVWDTFETRLKPDAQKAHKDVYGYYFTEVEATPLTVRFPDGTEVTYRGGYMPAKADPDLEEVRPGQVSVDGVTEAGGEFASRHPSAPKGFTITRTAANRALIHDLRLVPQAFAEELQFIHMQRAGKDLAALLNDREVSAAIRAVDPDAIGKMFQPWLSDTMRDRLMQPGGDPTINRLLVGLRRNVGLAYMFGNLANGMQQLTGLSTSATYVPLKFLRSAAKNYLRRGETAKVLEASKFMRARIDKRLGQITDDMQVLLKPTWYGKAKSWTQRNGYFLQRWFQVPVDVITWMGAHDHAVSQGKTAAQAVAWADATVRRSQGSGTAADISRFERSSAPIRLLTQFGGFWLAQFNTLAQRHGVERATAAANVVLFAGVTAGAISQALKGGWDDDDEDGQLWDDVASWTFGEAVRTGASLVPVVGPGAYRLLAGGYGGGRVSPAASLTALEQAVRGLDLFAAALDPNEDATGADVKNAALLTSILLGVPFTAPARPVSYQLDVSRGNVQPGGAVDYGRGLATGYVAPGTRQ